MMGIGLLACLLYLGWLALDGFWIESPGDPKPSIRLKRWLSRGVERP